MSAVFSMSDSDELYSIDDDKDHISTSTEDEDDDDHDDEYPTLFQEQLNVVRGHCAQCSTKNVVLSSYESTTGLSICLKCFWNPTKDIK